MTFSFRPYAKKGVAVAAKFGGKLSQSVNNNRQPATANNNKKITTEKRQWRWLGP
jgi:hypothetical protein